MKIRMRLAVEGQFHGMPGPRVGDVVEVPDSEAVRYCELGYAEPVAEEILEEHAVVSDDSEKRDEPKRRGRPPKPRDEHGQIIHDE